ncbi:frr [Lepeophtheirus salmonis]|uniref:Ribosome-recycling factor, mitochondrial n=1 Tax=Lepeophtheirus salmonis TaxID=72036 RepID=A0A7R8D3H4_LEPSM|nr:frr [Lepeophtheirus salmonis]CAF3017015.1 frr [Lepeophtheirus salmonis]
MLDTRPNPPYHIITFIMRHKSTKKSSKDDKNKKMSFSEMLDDLDDDDDEEEYRIEEQKQSKSISKSKGNRGKHPSAHKGLADYYDVNTMIKVEEYWSELDTIYQNLIQYFSQHLTIRSPNALDNLEIQFEGDTYPLHEIATISKKDPKRLIIDCSSFPTVSSIVVDSVTKSNMNLSPQQDGTTVYVPIPKITREYRENLVKGAKKNTFQRYCKLPKDKHHVVEEIIRSISNEFLHRSEELLKIKQNEIMGK